MYSPSFARSGRPLCFLMALSYFTFLIEQAKCLTTIDWIFFIDINFRLRKHVEKGAVTWLWCHRMVLQCSNSNSYFFGGGEKISHPVSSGELRHLLTLFQAGKLIFLQIIKQVLHSFSSTSSWSSLTYIRWILNDLLKGCQSFLLIM